MACRLTGGRPWGVAFVSGTLLLAQAPGQPPALPHTYSFTATSALSGPTTLNVKRNGSKQLVEMASASGSMNLRVLYDFQAHRIYTVDLKANTCTTQEYASPYAPPLWDPIGGAGEMARQAASLKAISREAVNGISTRLAEAALPDGKGRYKVWLEEKFGFPVKQAVVMGSQPERVVFEMRQLAYEPSPASLFVAPAECTRIGGVTNATGGRAEFKVGASAQAEAGQGGGAQGPPAGDPNRLIGKWEFIGKDGSGVPWRGTITISKLEANSFDSAKYSNNCDVDLSSANSGKGFAGPCLYDGGSKAFTFAGGWDSNKYSLTAVSSPDGKSLTQGRWTDASGNGSWSATLK